MTGRRHERGLALVMVLWVIAALSLIAGAMLAASMTSTVIARRMVGSFCRSVQR